MMRASMGAGGTPARRVMVFAMAFFCGTSCGFASSYFEERNLAKLQRRYSKQVADPIPWAGYWWPYVENGIADATHDSRSLSPAAKIDRVFGRRNYASAWEQSRHGFGRGAADWWGHCNGWATAAIMELEPRSKRTFDGVTFGVHDRKALLTEYWMQSGADFIGKRVNNPSDTSSAAFWDVTPAQFHLMMTNVVGRNKRSVIVDRYTGAEVWNHPVVAYEIHPIRSNDYLGRDPQYRNIHRVNIRATVWWASDQVEPDILTPAFEWKQRGAFEKRSLRYELWLDAPPEFDDSGNLVRSGDIIVTRNGRGGVWKNGASRAVLIDSHPDFIWIPLSYARSTGLKNPRINDQWIHDNLAD